MRHLNNLNRSPNGLKYGEISMRTFLSFIVLACLLVLLAECNDLAIFVISKVVASVVLVILGKILTTYFLTSEELNEEI